MRSNRDNISATVLAVDITRKESEWLSWATAVFLSFFANCNKYYLFLWRRHVKSTHVFKKTYEKEFFLKRKQKV